MGTSWRSRTGLAGPMRSRHEVNAGGKRAYLPLQTRLISTKSNSLFAMVSTIVLSRLLGVYPFPFLKCYLVERGSTNFFSVPDSTTAYSRELEGSAGSEN